MTLPGIAAAAGERIGAVVWFDALVPAAGERAHDLIDDVTMARMLDLTERSGDGWLVPPDTAKLRSPEPGDGVGSPAWIAARLTGQPLASYTEPSVASASDFAGPQVFVRCTWGHVLPAAMADRARAHGWRVVDLEAPHNAMLTHPDATADLLVAIASG